MKKNPSRLKNRLEGIDAYIWMIPTLILLVLFVLRPVLEVFVMAFSKISPAGLNKGFGTLENFKYLMDKPAFLTTLSNTAIWTIAVVGISLLISLTLALVLNEEFKGRGLARTILLLPWATSGLITASAWKYIFDYQYGALNALLIELGLVDSGVNFMKSPASAFTCMIVVGIVVTIPFMTFTLLSGLQSIPKDLYEAAEIDGAGFWDRLFGVTLPQLKPALDVTIVLNVIYVFNSFTIINTMTNGAPANKTHTVTSYMYMLAFSKNKYGAAAAVTVISFIVLTIFAVMYMRLQMKDEVAE